MQHRAMMILATLTQVCAYTYIFTLQGTALSQKGICSLPDVQSVFLGVTH